MVTVALKGALNLIAQAGGGVVEGYPRMPGEKKTSSSFLYNGTRAVYERAGFDFLRPKGLKNTVMRLICVKNSGRVCSGFLGQAARVAAVGASDSSRARAGVR